MSRTSRIAGSFTIVLIVYWAYALLAVPWIEPSLKQGGQGGIDRQARERASKIADEQLDRIRKLFPAGGMKRLGLEKPIIIESNQAKLLFQTYEHDTRGDGAVVLRPCAIIFAHEGPAEDEAQRARQAVILEAPGGARLLFDPPLDINRAKIGRLVKGELVGPVAIHSGWKLPGPEDDLRIDTRDVQLSEYTIFTPHAVDFRWGLHFGRGREMVMQLLAGKPRPGMETACTNIAGVESFELRRIERLQLDLGQALAADRLAADGTSARKGMPVEIRCRGPFRFDVLKRVASFSNRVDVLKLNPGGPADQIACDLLSLYFAERTKKAGKGEAGEMGSLDLIAERLECRGNPAVVTAPSRNLSARGPQIEYNLITQVLAATGPGRLNARIGGPAERQLEAVWQKTVRYYPHQQKKVISLDGGAELKLEGLGRLRAGEIFFWLAESPDAREKTARLSPDRMLARGSVRLDSAQLACLVNQMEVWFEERVGRDQGSGVGGQGTVESYPFSGRRHDGQAGAGSTVQLPPQHSELPPQHTESPLQLLPPTSLQQYELSGRLLQANVLLDGSQPALSSLLVQDGVCIREILSAQTGGQPLSIRGDRLTASDVTAPNAVVKVEGKPARFEGQGLGLSGANINLDRGANRLWIDGPGRMDVPLPEDLSDPISGGVLTVDWRREMVFDGTAARFEESVVASGPSQQLRTETLVVQMQRKVSFLEPDPSGRPQVEYIRCPKEATLENRSFDKQQQLASYDRLRVVDLNVNALSGALTAGGPGWVNSVSRGGVELPGREGSSTPPDPAGGDPSSKDDQLYCLTIRFEGSISGNLRQRQLTFHDQVRAARAPVADWNAVLGTDNPDLLGPEGVTLSCERLSAVDMPAPTGKGRSVELEADGDVRVDGMTYSAQGHRITYSEAKDLLVLEGDGRSDAVLSRQLRPGTPPSKIMARKILYRPKKGLELKDVRFLEAAQIPDSPGTK